MTLATTVFQRCQLRHIAGRGQLRRRLFGGATVRAASFDGVISGRRLGVQPTSTTATGQLSGNRLNDQPAAQQKPDYCLEYAHHDDSKEDRNCFSTVEPDRLAHIASGVKEDPRCVGCHTQRVPDRFSLPDYSFRTMSMHITADRINCLIGLFSGTSSEILSM